MNLFKPKSKIQANILEIFSILLFFVFFSLHRYIPIEYRYSSYYWVPMFFIILAFSYSSGIISKILSNSFFVKLGHVSFAFYLIHQLVIIYIMYLVNKYSILLNRSLLSFIMLLVSGLASFIMHYYIELPLNEKIKSLFTKTRIKEVKPSYDAI